MQAAFLDTSAPTGGFQSFRALKQGTQRALIEPRTRAIYVGSIRLSQRFRWEESDGVADSFTRRGGSEVRATLKLEPEARNERTTALLRKKPLPARLVELNRWHSQGSSGVGRVLRKHHVCGAGPLGDRSLPGELIGLHPRVLRQTQPCPNISEVGRFLRKRHVCGAGPLGDRSLPGKLIGRHWEACHSI